MGEAHRVIDWNRIGESACHNAQEQAKRRYADQQEGADREAAYVKWHRRVRASQHVRCADHPITGQDVNCTHKRQSYNQRQYQASDQQMGMHMTH